MFAFSVPQLPLFATPRNRRQSPLCSTSSAKSYVQLDNNRLPSDGNVTRRQAINLLATLTVTAAMPRQAKALSKKRIMAKAGPPTTLPSGIVYRDITVGKGYSPRNGDTVAIHYSLFFQDLEVESSRESQGLAASPLGFTYGARSGPGSVIQGINIGMEGMKVGGLRLISVPPELAFGQKGKQPLIPGNATVDFAVSLLSCKRQGTNPNSTINPKSQSF